MKQKISYTFYILLIFSLSLIRADSSKEYDDNLKKALEGKLEEDSSQGQYDQDDSEWIDSNPEQWKGVEEEPDLPPRENIPKSKEWNDDSWFDQVNYPSTFLFRAGYFFFTNSKMDRVFHENGFDFQLFGSFPIWKMFQFYGSAEWAQRLGKSIGKGEKTRINLIPGSIGLKLSFNLLPAGAEEFSLSHLQYYITVGPKLFYIHVKNHSPYVDRSLDRFSVGGVVGTGIGFYYFRYCLFDFFAEYSFRKIQFHTHKENTYGEKPPIDYITVGGGLGYAF